MNVAEETIRVLQILEAQYHKQLSLCSDEKSKRLFKRKLDIVEDELQNNLKMVCKE